MMNDSAGIAENCATSDRLPKAFRDQNSSTLTSFALSDLLIRSRTL